LRLGHLPSPRGLGENTLGDEARWLCRRSALGRDRLELLLDDLDDLDGPSSAAAGGLSLAALESSLDLDEATLAKVAASETGGLAPEDHVVELGVALAVRGDLDGRDGLAGAGFPKLGSGNKATDEGDLVTESPRDWRSRVAGFFVLLVVLLGISAPPVVWIDATGKSRTTAERNRSSRYGFSLLGLVADTAVVCCLGGGMTPEWRS